jgi:hypothetical protein
VFNDWNEGFQMVSSVVVNRGRWRCGFGGRGGERIQSRGADREAGIGEGVLWGPRPEGRRRNREDSWITVGDWEMSGDLLTNKRLCNDTVGGDGEAQR